METKVGLTNEGKCWTLRKKVRKNVETFQLWYWNKKPIHNILDCFKKQIKTNGSSTKSVHNFHPWSKWLCSNYLGCIMVTPSFLEVYNADKVEKRCKQLAASFMDLIIAAMGPLLELLKICHSRESVIMDWRYAILEKV